MRDLQNYVDEDYRKAPEEVMRLYDGKTVDDVGIFYRKERKEHKEDSNSFLCDLCVLCGSTPRSKP